jgi:hypothetical protein
MDNRLFIIEGPDCSGKTTLAKFLSHKLDMVYMHMSGHPALHRAMPEYHQQTLDSIEWNMKENGMRFVLDRSWPSEWVYGREFRTHLVDRFPFKEFQDRLQGLGAKYVFCMDDKIEERHAAEHVPKNHLPYDRSDFHGVVVGYQILMTTMTVRPDVYTYDLEKDGANLADVVGRILEPHPKERFA